MNKLYHDVKPGAGQYTIIEQYSFFQPFILAYLDFQELFFNITRKYNNYHI